MANIHVLTTSGADVNVVCHVPIPNANNAVGVNWQTALINSGIGGTTTLKDGDGTAGTISAAEKASIVSGALYEAVAVVRPQGVATGGVNAFLTAQFNAIKADALSRLQDRLNYFGVTA